MGWARLVCTFMCSARNASSYVFSIQSFDLCIQHAMFRPFSFALPQALTNMPTAMSTLGNGWRGPATAKAQWCLLPPIAVEKRSTREIGKVVGFPPPHALPALLVLYCVFTGSCCCRCISCTLCCVLVLGEKSSRIV